jgi:oxalate decarboxylase/phosphoglucose isomerase-like protein (cupin superfamily)
MAMKHLLFVLVLALATLAVAQQAAKKSTDAKPQAAKTEMQHTYSPQQVKWGLAPPFIPPGAQLAVLEGDPGASSGTYTVRVKTPDGYIVAPHWHPKRESVTVISGSMAVAMGDKFDAAKLKPISAGGFFYMDPDMHHYVKMQGPTVVQIHGESPLAFNYVNPADDPQRRTP